MANRDVVDVRDPATGHLLFRYDPERERIHVRDKRRGIDAEVDLRKVRKDKQQREEDDTGQ